MVVDEQDEKVEVGPPVNLSGFQSFENAAADVVLTIGYNSAGSRFAVASADHKIRIYDCKNQTRGGPMTLLDQWRAHDAEILDVQWAPGPFVNHFATTATDNKVKIWREDPSQPPVSGRRFRCVFSQTPASHVFYTSFEFHETADHDIYLALFTHDGLLSLLEPSVVDSLSNWRQIDQFYPFGKFPRGSEPRFRLVFHQSIYPSLNTNLPPTTLSIATSAANVLKIYRGLTTILPDDPVSQTFSTTEPSIRLQECLEFALDPADPDEPIPPVINSIAWRPGLISPDDIIAAACDDGTIRIVEVTTPWSPRPDLNRVAMRRGHPPSSSGSTTASTPTGDQEAKGSHRRDSTASATARTIDNSSAAHPAFPVRVSGIGAGLAGMMNPRTAEAGERPRTEGPIELKHYGREKQILRHGAADGGCWKVEWTHAGSGLLSSGDNGDVVLWGSGIGDNGDLLEWSRTRPAD